MFIVFKMTDITVDNFDEKFPEIVKSLQNAKFIGIDLEFSALYPLKGHSPSLFDSPNERYIKLRRNLTHVIPIQIGLTAFSFEPDKNSYHGTVYNFYVVPASFPTINRTFYFQSDTLNFLKLYGFDFNKFIYKGIPFINTDQEVELRKKLKNGDIIDNISECRTEINEILEEVINEINKWYYAAKDGDQFSIPNLYEKQQNNIQILYFVHRNLRGRFKNMWTAVEGNQFVLKKVSNDEYKTLEKSHNLEDALIKSLLGFTNVFRILTSLRKPIVGHNSLQDILLMINTFQTALPNSYSAFKKLTIELFPTIFDTKVITYEMKHLISEEKQWNDSSLETLFEFFKNGTGRHLALNSPAIEMGGENNYGKFHQAGWDSFCAGYIFIRLAHLKIFRDYPKSKNFVSSELIAGLSELKNYLNVIRGSVSSIKIDGDDPSSTRPPFLVIESLKNKIVDVPQITSLLSSYGFVEVRKFPYHDRRVLIAVDNFSSARRILNSFKAHNEFQIRQYSAIKHSPMLRAVLLSGITISGALLLWLTHNAIKR